MKKILFGSMLVLTLILLMPSIPAIQMKTIEDSLVSDFSNHLDLIDENMETYLKEHRTDPLLDLIELLITILKAIIKVIGIIIGFPIFLLLWIFRWFLFH